MSRTARAKRWLRLHLTGNRQRYRNWLNRRTRARGKTPLPDRVTRAAGSRVPGYRNRVNPATGRPRRDDRVIGRVKDQSLARSRAENELLRARVQAAAAAINAREGHASIPATHPAERNQQHVRDLLAGRQPQFARTLDRAVRDLSQRTGRSR